MVESLKKNTVAAVIALYNGRDHVSAAIDSIMSQTTAVDEIIIVDDGSTDGSSNLVASIVSTNSKAKKLVKVITQKNQGQGSARNAGVAAASSELIGFLDQDDTWEPEHVSRLSQHFVANPILGWAYSDFNEFDEQDRYVRRQFLQLLKYEPPAKSLFALIGMDLMMLPSAALVRREAFLDVGGFDTQFRGYEDDDLFLRVFVAGWDFEFVPESLVNYRIHPNNSSRNLSFPQSRIRFYKKYRNYFDEQTDYFIKFRSHLVSRMVTASLHDVAVSYRDGNKEARKLARDFLKELSKDANSNFRSELIYLASSNRLSLRGVMLLRRIRRSMNKKRVRY